MRLLCEFELNEEEKQQRTALEKEFENSLLQGRLFSWEEYGKQIRTIQNKARQRSLIYFRTSPQKLFEELKEEVKTHAAAVAFSEKTGGKMTVKKGKDFLTEYISPYLEILKEHTPKEYNSLISFIDEVFEHRADILEEETEKTQEKKPQKIKAIKPQKVSQTVDKLSQSLFDPKKNELFYNCDAVDLVISSGNKKEVKTAVSININELDNISFSNGFMLDPYCKAVHDALVSLYVAGNKGASYNTIYKVMNGNKPTLKAPEEKTLKEISDSIEKMRHTDVTIEIIDEAKLYKFAKLKIKDYVLPVRIATLSVNGQTAEGVIFRGEPPLYEYARQKNQVNTADIKFLDIPLSATRENTIIANYLLERVQGALNPKSNLGNIIRYDAIYEKLGLKAPNDNALRQKRSDVRKKIKAILSAWIKAKLIKGFEEIKEGNAIAKIKILT